ncbi:MAG: PKD domain-containing protein [Bacteroidota bacterium]
MLRLKFQHFFRCNVHVIKLLWFLTLFIFTNTCTFGQVPTVQDCLGAIPLCQDIYSTTNSYSGTGNYPNEVDPNSCNINGESNSVWYEFTVQTSGNVSFIITPNDGFDDYDWAVYNLTNANCSDVYTNPSLMVSCNSYGALVGSYNGPTGASTAMGGTTNSNGPGDTNGPPWNADIPVVAGQTYVIYLADWSGSPNGYTIDFSSSTAQIFDNIPPELDSISSSVNCGLSSMTFNFSENVLCNTVQTGDFILNGPAGPYTITSITGSACLAGGNQENTFTINISPSVTQGGTYYLELVTTSGSVADLCGNVAPNDSLPFTINIPDVYVNNDTICAGESATLTAAGASTYSWSGGLGSGNPKVVTPAVTTTYTVTGISTTGCTNTATSIVVVYPLPIVAVNSLTICAGESATLTTPSGAASYLWNPGGATTSSITVSPTTTNTYTVTATSAEGCTNTDSCVVTAYPLPTSSFDLPDTTCTGANVTVTYIGTAATSATYYWDFGGGSIVSGNGQGPYVITWNNPGLTTVSLSVTENGCISNTTSQGIFIESAPIPLFSAFPTDGCIPLTVTFTNNSQNVNPSTTYLWEFGNGATSNLPTPSHIYNNPGTYSVSLTTGNGNCFNTLTIPGYIEAYPIPSVEIITYPRVVSFFEPTIDFSYTQVGNVTDQTWIISDGTYSSDQTFAHTFQDTGIFVVTLIVTNQYGCVDTVRDVVWVRSDYTLYVPNCFTPDIDGINDVFMAYGQGILDFELDIFDRWGEQVFHSKDINHGWDGTFKGTLCKEDIYIYRILYTDALKKKHSIAGHFTLLK